MASAPITGTALYDDANGTELTCNLAPTPGTAVDVGMSDIFIDSCTGAPPPSGVGQFSGPVEAMLFVVPKASQQTAISARTSSSSSARWAPTIS